MSSPHRNPWIVDFANVEPGDGLFELKGDWRNVFWNRGFCRLVK